MSVVRTLCQGKPSIGQLNEDFRVACAVIVSLVWSIFYIIGGKTYLRCCEAYSVLRDILGVCSCNVKDF